jgi:hypothetical protein
VNYAAELKLICTWRKSFVPSCGQCFCLRLAAVPGSTFHYTTEQYSHSPEHMCGGDALRVERPTQCQCWLDCISTRLSHQFICVSTDDTMNVRLRTCYVIMLPSSE